MEWLELWAKIQIILMIAGVVIPIIYIIAVLIISKIGDDNNAVEKRGTKKMGK